MADFEDQDLRGSRFQHVDLRDSVFVDVDLRQTTFRAVAFHDVVMRGCELGRVRIDGEIEEVVINGVDVAPLVDAELNRRDPERAMMRPTDADGFRAAWTVLERRWAQTVERARGLTADQVHESVDGEWSFVETLRHLAFATDAWLSRAVLGEPSPWHPLELPWDEMEDTPGVPRDRSARPSLEETLALRDDRAERVRAYLADLTDAELDRQTTPVDVSGWPPAGRSFAVRDCLLTIVNEEWEHRRFAERDLDAVTGR